MQKMFLSLFFFRLLIFLQLELQQISTLFLWLKDKGRSEISIQYSCVLFYLKTHNNVALAFIQIKALLHERKVGVGSERRTGTLQGDIGTKAYHQQWYIRVGHILAHLYEYFYTSWYHVQLGNLVWYAHSVSTVLRAGQKFHKTKQGTSFSRGQGKAGTLFGVIGRTVPS